MSQPANAEPRRSILRSRLTPIQGIIVVVALAAAAGLGGLLIQFASAWRLKSQARAALPRYVEEIRVQRQSLVAAIEAYKSRLGLYPPDHLLSRNPPSCEPVTNQLLYELLGSFHDVTNQSFKTESHEAVQLAYMRSVFNIDSFTNTSLSETGAPRFLDPNTPHLGSLEAHDSPDVNVLKYVYSDLDYDPDIDALIETGSWRYISSSPRHNPGKFDLWCEIKTGWTNIVVGNWKEVE